MARNQIIDAATEPLAELMSVNPAKRMEILKDQSFLQSAKIQNNEADIEKIKNILMKIIRDIKEDMAEQQPTGAIATAEAVKGIRAALPDKPQSELTAEDVSAALTAYVPPSFVQALHQENRLICLQHNQTAMCLQMSHDYEASI